MKKFFIIVSLLTSSIASASTTDCKGLYVGRIWVEKGVGLKAVVYLNNRGDSSGSYWSYFNGWAPDERKEALSMLMTAKVSNHRLDVTTENADGCGMQAAGTVTKVLHLTTNP